MIRVIFATVCIFAAAFGSFSQARKAPSKSPVKPKAAVVQITEIPSENWNEITKALDDEDWEKTSRLSQNALKNLKSENEKQQLARLRYFYLFAAAGKVSQGKMTAKELENIIQTQIGKDFILLDRTVLADCDKSLNYVCRLKIVVKHFV